MPFIYWRCFLLEIDVFLKLFIVSFSHIMGIIVIFQYVSWKVSKLYDILNYEKDTGKYLTRFNSIEDET